VETGKPKKKSIGVSIRYKSTQKFTRKNYRNQASVNNNLSNLEKDQLKNPNYFLDDKKKQINNKQLLGTVSTKSYKRHLKIVRHSLKVQCNHYEISKIQKIPANHGK
jgi:hypothetical protein